MDKITDLFQGLKERLNNPLIGSFIIAWLIINWQVPIGIIFYGNETLAIDGFKSKIDLIQKTYSPWYCIWLPLFSAITYILLIPVFKNLMQAYNTWKKRWGTKLSLKISKGGFVPIESYVKLSDKLEDEKKRLAEQIRKESFLETEKNALSKELQDFREQRIKQQIIDQANYDKIQINSYSGFWKITYIENPLAVGGSAIQARVEIVNETLTLVEMGKRVRPIFFIRNITYNLSLDEVCIAFEDPITKEIFFELFSLHPRKELKRLQNKSSFSHKRILELERE